MVLLYLGYVIYPMLLLVIIIYMMPKYKTPFPASQYSAKDLQGITAKYKLPFEKESFAQVSNPSLISLQPTNIKLDQSTKLPTIISTSQIAINKLKRKCKNSKSIPYQYMQVLSQKQQVAEGQTFNMHNLINQTNSHYQLRPVRPKQQHNRQKYSSNKRQYLSTSSNYDQVRKKQDQKPMQEEYQADVEWKNPQQMSYIQQSKIYDILKQEQEDYTKLFERLSQDINEYEQKKQKWNIQRKKISSRNRQIVNNLKAKINIQPYLQDQTKLAKNPKAKRSTSSVYQLPSINVKQKREPFSQNGSKKTLMLFDKLNQYIKKPKDKNNSRKPLEFFLNAFEQIKQINPFFRKLSPMEGCVLLNIGKLTIFDEGKLIYQQGENSRELSVIIYGKVLLTNKRKTFRKFALTGQTLGEEQLFENQKTYVQRLQQAFHPPSHKYDAKALNKSCLLRIQLPKYYRMSVELSRTGYKQQFNLIDNLFKINYLNKQTNRKHRFRVATQPSIPKKQSHEANFIY